jgi:phosphoribosylformimino-5-aminoimidazole carboxamide ribotide isomerase
VQLIPSIDLRGGQCVRLLRGDFSAETRYDHSPLELLRRYRALGSQWLHVVDLDGARDGELANHQVIAQLASEPGIRLQVGGGVRTRAVVENLLAMGVARLVIGSAAVDDRAAVVDWLRQFGPERICLAFDVQLEPEGLPLLRTHGWQQPTALSLWETVESYLGSGLLHVLCTDIARDGAMAGPNVALYAQALERFPQLHWQASGGVSGVGDLQALAKSGVAAAISGRALLEERLTHGDLQPYLPGA